ncbi:MAG: hypothetical protein RR205_05240 [Oscillospiraceae bacterium]
MATTVGMGTINKNKSNDSKELKTLKEELSKAIANLDGLTAENEQLKVQISELTAIK